MKTIADFFKGNSIPSDAEPLVYDYAKELTEIKQYIQSLKDESVSIKADNAEILTARLAEIEVDKKKAEKLVDEANKINSLANEAMIEQEKLLELAKIELDSAKSINTSAKEDIEARIKSALAIETSNDEMKSELDAREKELSQKESAFCDTKKSFDADVKEFTSKEVELLTKEMEVNAKLEEIARREDEVICREQHLTSKQIELNSASACAEKNLDEASKKLNETKELLADIENRRNQLTQDILLHKGSMVDYAEKISALKSKEDKVQAEAETVALMKKAILDKENGK